MKKDYCHITLLIDRSGSMESMKADTIKGVNGFINEQRTTPGDCTLTLVQFDEMQSHEVIYDMLPLSAIGRFGETYNPRYRTPLYDAMGKAIKETGRKLSAMREEDRPDKVVMVVQTDGLENASVKYTQAAIRKLVEHQTTKWNWQFVFMGANINTEAQAQSFSVPMDFAADYVPVKAMQAYMVSATNVRSYRTGASATPAYTHPQKADLKSSE